MENLKRFTMIFFIYVVTVVEYRLNGKLEEVHYNICIYIVTVVE